MSAVHWCEFCQDNYPGSHFDADGDHLVGPQYGPTGAAMEAERCPDCIRCPRHAATASPSGSEPSRGCVYCGCPEPCACSNALGQGAGNSHVCGNGSEASS